jgi:Tol biopolymer transport system component
LPVGQYGLTGRLLLIQYDSRGNRLLELDLTTGASTVTFQAPSSSWLGEAAVSPDGRTVVIAYAPPSPTGESQFGYTGLYMLPRDGSGPPQPLLTPGESGEAFFYLAWAPDGRSIFYTHLRRLSADDPQAVRLDVEASDLEGRARTVIPNAIWPAVSPDGSMLAYLPVDEAGASSELYLARSDGTDARALFTPGSLPPIDAHLFSADGTGLIFSMVNSGYVPPRSWWDGVLGIETAYAHSVPSDWYASSIDGAPPRRLTNTVEANLIGALSPDGSRLAFLGAGGLYVVPAEGGEATYLSEMIFVGSIGWIP